jgi:hypothetical protein
LDCGDLRHRFSSRKPQLALHGVKAAPEVAAVQTAGVSRNFFTVSALAKDRRVIRSEVGGWA